MSDSLQELIADLAYRGVVCPLPMPWEKLCNLIRAGKIMAAHPIEKGPETQLKNPLILAGWGASNIAKWERFQYHLEEAEKLGLLPAIRAFLDKLESHDFLTEEAACSD